MECKSLIQQHLWRFGPYDYKKNKSDRLQREKIKGKFSVTILIAMKVILLYTLVALQVVSNLESYKWLSDDPY